MTTRRRLVTFGVAALLAGCGSERTATTTSSSSTTTTVKPTTTVANPTTSTSALTTTVPLTAPPVTSVEVSARPRAEKSVAPCDNADGTQYCIWGTKPLDLVVNNSRLAAMERRIVQDFTAVDVSIESVRVQVVSNSIGALTPLEGTVSDDRACVRVLVRSAAGVDIGVVNLVSTSDVGVLQMIDLPMTVSVVPGSRYSLLIEKGLACADKDLSTWVAMSSEWKYPASAGRLTIDGRSSNGSVWARIE